MQPTFLLIFLILVLRVKHSFSQADDISLDDDDFDFDSEGLIDSIRGAMDTLFDYMGNEDGCFYRCSSGGKPVSKPGHTPKANGCGAFGLKLDTTHVPAMERCCDLHDRCYDTCNRAKAACDDQFRDCLTTLCKDVKPYVSTQIFKGCMSTADMMYAATMALGCKPYRDSQREACVCPHSPYTEL
ncbi:group XIIA secretory phospholipase A2-like [Babylonia areolata]|uniref:group XIIA secretory phospholipase A2-like n=1 Tax=Babylonia areolata TaxID=304850 RepID=UPI003FD48D1F